MQVKISGIVQGVGFRPFVYNLAVTCGLKGFVYNDTEGVTIGVEGERESIESFLKQVEAGPPPLARINDIKWETVKPQGFREFTVQPSRTSAQKTAFIPPDTGICEACLKEFLDPEDRRYHYPFITCTHCGPRFSIVKDIPYDRRTTAMDIFPLCRRCRQEYDNPADRRFHTEPTACPECGPHLSFYNNRQELIAEDTEVIVRRTIDRLKAGKIMAIKGVGGFHLAVDAQNDRAVRLLRQRKQRPFKPFALMAASVDRVKEFCRVTEREAALLESRERPIVLLKETARRVSPMVAPHLTFIGVMLPYTPFQHLLFCTAPDMILVMTSGNISDEPIIYTQAAAFAQLGHIADYFVAYNRDIVAQADDSVIFVEQEIPYFIRRSKGFVPAPIPSSRAPKHILAFGGDLKNSFAVAKDEVIILSQYIGDLSSPLTQAVYRRTLAHFEQVFAVRPEVVVSDLHPGYFSSMMAEEYEKKGLRHLKVQHHHAHIAAVLEEHQLNETVIGLAFDGTGYGSDGRIWGGEFLIADRKEFKRAGHFSYFPLPGGERAIRQVWRIGLALLQQTFGRDLFAGSPQRQMVLEMIQKGINAPLCCSVGRLFDGIANLLGLSDTVSTEAEAAMKLEELALKGEGDRSFAVDFQENDGIVIKSEGLVRGVMAWLERGEKPEDIAFAFHKTIAHVSAETAAKLRDRFKLNKVALSGGVFQNRLLLNMMLTDLAKKGFEVLTSHQVPANDGCLALGQIATAKQILKTR